MKSPKALAFRVAEAENGEVGLQACQAEMPDVILLDWNMPVMDGYSFLKHLRAMPEGQAPKVVFCTTENDIDHITRALDAGANEYIMKPFDRDIRCRQVPGTGHSSRFPFSVTSCRLLLSLKPGSCAEPAHPRHDRRRQRRHPRDDRALAHRGWRIRYRRHRCQRADGSRCRRALQAGNHPARSSRCRRSTGSRLCR